MADGKQPLDLTGIESPRFEYTVRDAEGKGPATVSLDFDRIGLDLNLSVPTLFQPTGEQFEDGTPKTGMSLFLEHVRTGHPLAPSLPGVAHVEHAVRSAFQVPKHCGVKVVFAVLGAWLNELAERSGLKKNTPASPASPEPTPGA